MRKRFSRAESEDFGHGIDLAPMLDFVTNLLIFFIITAVFVKESGLLVNRPTAFEQPKETDSQGIQIQILDNGDVWMDSRQVDVRAVRANVERQRAVDSQAGALIIAQAGAPTGVLVEVVDQVHLGGVYNITFSTQE